NADLVPPKINNAVMLLVSAAPMTNRQLSIVVAAVNPILAIQQRLVRLVRREILLVIDNSLESKRMCFLAKRFNSHLQILSVFDHFLAFAERDIGLLPVRPVTHILSATAHLTGNNHRPYGLNLHFEELLDGFLDLLLACLVIHFETKCSIVFLERKSLFR